MKRNRKQNNTDFIVDGYNSLALIQLIKEIRDKYNIKDLKESYTENDSEYKMIGDEYNFFKERYPFLFDMTLKPDMDMNRLEYMINLREQIVNNQTTFEKASQKIGTEMYNEYHVKK